MRLSATYIIAFLLISLSSLGQAKDYKALLDLSFEHSGLFVSLKPSTRINLNNQDMWRYAENLKEYAKAELDTLMFRQIIENSKKPDTALWKEAEIPKYILINDRNEKVSLANITSKFELAGKKLTNQDKSQIRQFNQTAPSDRNVYYFSRPVFDNSGKFAIVQYDNGHGGLGGGGAIVLYKKTENTWLELGVVLSWRY